jgi:hypothetical protein
VVRRGFQNHRDHQSCALDVGSLRVQVRDQGSIKVGAGIDIVLVVVVLEDNDPLGSGELLFQVMSVGLILRPSEGGAQASSRILYAAAMTARRTSCSRDAVAATSSSFLLAAAAACTRSDRMGRRHWETLINPSTATPGDSPNGPG